MSMSTFVALCLLALPPSDCPGGCYPQHHLPFLGRHVLPSLDGQFDWSGDYGGLMAGEWSVVPPLPEPASPVVLLRSLEVGVADQQSFLASSDRPAYWTAVPFAPLSVEVQVPIAAAEIAPTEPLEYVVLLLDGKPVENNRYLTGAQPAPVPSADGQLRMAYIFNFPCPAPGKHIVQARYKMAGLWSRISEPLHFDVRLPDPPRIVAISDVNGVPAPVRKAGLISITKPEVIVRLANVSQNASVVAYLDGKPISTTLAQESCCRTLRLQGHITPGIHSLRLRTVTSGGSCSVTSDPSDEVVFHYYDEDVYLLRPNQRCNSCPTPANSGSQASHAVAPPSTEAEPIQQPARRFITASEKDTHYIQLTGFLREDRENPFRTANLLRNTAQEPANIRLVTFLAESPADEANRFHQEAQAFADATAPLAQGARSQAETAKQHAAAAETAAKEASLASVEAAAAQTRAQAEVAVATKAAQVAALSTAAEAEDARDDVARAKTAAAAALQQAQIAARIAAAQAGLSDAKAQDAKQISADAGAAKIDVETARQRAIDAAEQAKKSAADAVALGNRDAQKLQEKRDRALIERNLAEEWMKIAKQEADLVAGLAKNAADRRQQAVDAKNAAWVQMQTAQRAADSAVPNAVSARSSAITAVQQTINAAIVSIANTIKATDDALGKSAPVVDAANRAGVARMFAAEAKAAADAATTDATRANAAYDDAVRSVGEANKHLAKADSYVVEESKRGDTARLRVAQIHAKQATENRDAALGQKQLAADAYNQARQEAGQTHRASADAQASAATANQDEQNAKQHASTAASARADVVAAGNTANDASTIAQRAAAKNDLDLATTAVLQALNAKQAAETRSQDAKSEQGLSRQSADAITPTLSRVEKESTTAKAARQRTFDYKNAAEAAAAAARGYAAAAAQNAADAGRLLDLAKLIETDRDISKAEDEYRAMLPLLKDIEIQLAPDRAKAAKDLATAEEAYADERIVIGQARDRIERARAVQGSSSPFYFASTAHFPIREFGVQGEALDREGAVIYEDMAFSFDREGNYNVRFTIGTPAVPTTIQLRFLIQPCPNGPWYTITLEPIGFPPTKVADGKYTPSVFRNHVVEGKSEILRRCYGEMGQDATIRREGTARFGFGLAGLSQNKAG